MRAMDNTKAAKRGALISKGIGLTEADWAAVEDYRRALERALDMPCSRNQAIGKLLRTGLEAERAALGER